MVYVSVHLCREMISRYREMISRISKNRTFLGREINDFSDPRNDFPLINLSQIYPLFTLYISPLSSSTQETRTREVRAVLRCCSCSSSEIIHIFSRSSIVEAIGFEGDVRKREDAQRVVEATVKHFGKLDILVNAAAGNFLVSAEDLSPKGFKTVMDIDSVGTFTMCHEALKYLKKGAPGRNSSSGGFILNISATLHYTASWYQIHVSAAKAAVDALTRNLALEWGTDYDIRVNGIAPGPIGDTAGLSKLLPEEINNKAAVRLPLYKVGEKWDIAMAAIYLASDAGKYINGAVMPVDGGMWLSKPRQLPKDAVREVSRAVEKRSRAAPPGVPTSKL